MELKAPYHGWVGFQNRREPNAYIQTFIFNWKSFIQIIKYFYSFKDKLGSGKTKFLA